MEQNTGGFSFPDLKWFLGVVEDRMDPEKMGRVKVRIYGYHSGDQGKMATADLPWAIVNQSITSAAASGVGQSPTGLVEGSTVFGFFMDGQNAQTPMVVGSFGGVPTGKGFEGGFKDPNGKYPRVAGENDVNRLSRNEKISDTAVGRRRSGVTTGDQAFGGSWTEPASPYAAKYPFNHVRESESGHTEEWDDTAGAERMSRSHRTGTFEEIGPDGTKVVKVVKDSYHVTIANEKVYVGGNCTVVINGNSSLLVKGNADIEVLGNVKEHVGGNYTLDIDGNYDVTVGGHHYDNAGSHRKIVAPRIDLNP